MTISRLRSVALLLAVLAVPVPAATGCARMGDLGPGDRGVLAVDSRGLVAGDPAGSGLRAVVARGLVAEDVKAGDGEAPRDLDVALYQPADRQGPAPAVVFLPGRVAQEREYESYARALASRGLVVVVRGWYSPFLTDRELAADARALARWLVAHGLADPAHIGVAGHSMGGKNAILATAGTTLFNAVVAIDPDDGGRLSVAEDVVSTLTVPLLLIGAEVAWKASRMCAPKDKNYQRFFDTAPAGTVELELRGADHVQVMDDPESTFGICRVGTADSRAVRRLARGAVVSFFVEKLLGGQPMPLPLGDAFAMRVKGGVVRTARHVITPGIRETTSVGPTTGATH